MVLKKKFEKKKIQIDTFPFFFNDFNDIDSFKLV
jgi:hypothetical protein